MAVILSERSDCRHPESASTGLIQKSAAIAVILRSAATKDLLSETTN